MTWYHTLLQHLINGLALGAVYALIALGYTMVYGILQLINFAHGEVFMLGAYFGLSALLLGQVTGPLPGVWCWWVTGMMLLAILGCSLTGCAIERLAYRPLRRAPKLSLLITAIGMSFVLQNVVMLTYGAQDRHIPSVMPTIRWTVGGASVTAMQVVLVCSGLVVMLALHLFIRRTRVGWAMQATAQDPVAARLMGIPVDRIIALTFALGSALAAVGGVLFGLYYATVNFHDGYLMGLKAFTAAVLGGIGNIPGAMLGGTLLGLLESVGAGYLSSQWKNVFAFVILVLLLICRPRGLLGERVVDRD